MGYIILALMAILAFFAHKIRLEVVEPIFYTLKNFPTQTS